MAKDPEVVALEAQLRAVDAALKAVEADAPKAQRALGGFGDEAKDAAKGTGDATVSTSAFGVALGNLASNQMQRALDVLGEWVAGIPEAAGRAEAHARVLEQLGGAYEGVRAATAGAVTAEQANSVQQRAAQAGLHLTGRELAAVTQRAREYARVTGAELGPVLEQLTDQIIHPGDELAKFGVVVQQGTTRGEQMASVLRQLGEQSAHTAVSAQTLTESYDDFGRAQSELSDDIRATIASGLELNDFFQQASSWLRGLRGSTDQWGAALRAVAGTLGEVVNSEALQRLGAGPAQGQSTTGAFISQYGPLAQQARAAGITGLPMPADVARATPEEQARLLAALTRDVNARRAAGTTRSAPGVGAMFGAVSDADLAALPRIGDAGASTGLTSGSDVAREVAASIATRTAREAAERQRTEAAAAAQRRRELAPVSSGATATETAYDDSANARRLDASFAAARGAPVSGDWAAAFLAELRRLSGAQTASEGGTVGTRFAGVALQRDSAEAGLALGRGRQGADFDPTSRGGRDQAARERITILREQREALAALNVEAERAETMARAAGAPTDEVNGLMRQRIEIQRALAQSTQDLATAQEAQANGLTDFKDKLVDALGSTTDAFAEAVAAAAEGSKGFSASMEDMIRSTLRALLKLAVVEGLKNAAIAAGHLATANYPGAIQAGIAVGLWGAVGLAAGAGTAAMAKPAPAASTGPAPSGTGSGVGARPDTAARPDRAAGGPLVLNIAVSGAIFESRHEVLQGIARGVTEARVHGYLPEYAA